MKEAEEGGQMAGEDVVGEVEEFTLHIKTVWFSLKNTECSFGYGINVRILYLKCWILNF